MKSSWEESNLKKDFLSRKWTLLFDNYDTIYQGCLKWAIFGSLQQKILQKIEIYNKHVLFFIQKSEESEAFNEIVVVIS